MDKIIKPTIRQQVYEIIKNRIVEEYYKPGARLSEQELCDELHVSRSPIREALRELESDGLVVGEPNKGVTVKTLTKDDVLSFFNVEYAIEQFSISEKIKELTPEQVETFKKLLDDFKDSYAKKDVEKYVQVSDRFHTEVVKLSGNMFAIDFYNKIGSFSHRIRFLAFKNPKRLKSSYEEHINIVEALLDNDIPKALKLFENHRDKSLEAATLALPKDIEK